VAIVAPLSGTMARRLDLTEKRATVRQKQYFT
jgi:hypothetical protein